MDIYWYGQAFFKLKGKTATVIVDPFYPDFTGLKLPRDLSADIAMQTHSHQDHSNLAAITDTSLKIDGPGEYEAKGVAVTSIQTYHDSKEGAERGKNLVYNIEIDGLNVVHAGDLGQNTFEKEQLDAIGSCDILLIPVGGTYTIDSKRATEIISQLEPKIVIPMHYGIEGLKFPLDPVENFLKEMGAENMEPIAKLTVTKDRLPEELQVVLLSKQ